MTADELTVVLCGPWPDDQSMTNTAAPRTSTDLDDVIGVLGRLAIARRSMPEGFKLDVAWLTAPRYAARNELSGAVQSFGFYGPSHPTDFVGFARRLIVALEGAGIETAPVIERAAKKALREGGQHDIRTVLA